MERSAANPAGPRPEALDLLFASNLSGIQLHVDLGVVDNQYPDPSCFMAIKRACGSDATFDKFTAVFLDFERGVKSREQAIAEAFKLVTEQGSCSRLKHDSLHQMLLHFFSSRSTQESGPDQFCAPGRLQPAGASEGSDVDARPTSSDSTVAPSSCSNLTELKRSAPRCLCPGCPFFGARVAGSSAHVRRMEPEIVTAIVANTRPSWKENAVKFLAEAETVLQRTGYHAFLGVLDAFRTGTIADDFELKVVADSLIRRNLKAPGPRFVVHGNGSFSQCNDCSQAGAGEENVPCQDFEAPAGDVPARNDGGAGQAAERNRWEAETSGLNRARPLDGMEFDPPHPVERSSRGGQPIHGNAELPRASGDCTCTLCDGVSRAPALAQRLMRRLILLYSPHEPDCECGSARNWELGSYKTCPDPPRQRVDIEDTGGRKRNPVRSTRRPSSKLLEECYH